jgi:hypothetical protein
MTLKTPLLFIGFILQTGCATAGLNNAKEITVTSLPSAPLSTFE